MTDFGIFVELEEGIEGLIHISELGKDKGANALGKFKVDDVIQAKVMNVMKDNKKIGLSIKKLEESDERDIYRSYMDDHKGATSNLGELLRKGMMGLDSPTPEEEKVEEAPKDVSEVEGEASETDVTPVGEETEKGEAS